MPRNVQPLHMEFCLKCFRLRSNHSNIMKALDFLRLWSLITCWKFQGTLHFLYYLLFWYLPYFHFIWSSVFSSRVTGIGSGSKYSARSATFQKETEHNKVFSLQRFDGLDPSTKYTIHIATELEGKTVVQVWGHNVTLMHTWGQGDDVWGHSLQWPLFNAIIFLMLWC